MGTGVTRYGQGGWVILSMAEKADAMIGPSKQHAVELVDVLNRHSALPSFKALMAMIGFDCGPTRLPVVALTADETDSLRTDLNAIGFFDWGRA